ncbi:ABC transporter substrate-binding protein [Kineococcus rhizosphaerae]|uniref:Peptide/nickel transport system substrate-binding protein n=1 Tax=Kineococcus rhizosphaerae TaxID=559628 RepID=A0A2T0R165_9ACTN|nr:ABC transporter substrate-binding protein [Kineococcus rhizosphaerae]PRY13053.1 peptide/nickel transport system substrate-binding protein [Kineococcus rhizosphaerae]
MPASRLPTRTLLAALSVAVLTLTTTACSDTGSNGPENSGGPGGTLTTQFAGIPISLNPALGGSGGSAIFTALAYDSLIHQTGDGELIPDLATAWSFDPTNTVLTLTLRQGVKFSDGAPLDAAAVKASLEYFLSAGGGDLRYAGPVASVEAPSADTVVITYKTPYPDGPYYLTQYWGVGQVIGPKGLADPDSLLTATDGTGPYTYSASKSVTNSSYTYEKNPGYFAPEAQQYDSVVVKVIGDPSASLSAVTTGQVSFAGLTPTTAVSAKSSGLKLVTAPFFTWGLTVADHQGTLVPALANPDVRQAMALALDRDALASALGADYNQANGQLTAEGVDGHLDGYGFTQDLAEAKSLMASAGYPDGFTLPVLTENVLDNQTTISQAMAGDLAKIGVKVELVVKNTVPDFIQAALSKQYPVLVWPVIGSTSAQVLANFVQPGVTDPFGTADPTLTALYAQAQAASGADRTAVFEQITKASNEAAWFIPAVSTDNVFAVDADLQNVTASALNPNPLPVSPDPRYAWKSAE